MQIRPPLSIPSSANTFRRGGCIFTRRFRRPFGQPVGLAAGGRLSGCLLGAATQEHQFLLLSVCDGGCGSRLYNIMTESSLINLTTLPLRDSDTAGAIANLPRPVVHIKGYGSRILLEHTADPPPLLRMRDQPKVAEERKAAEALAAKLIEEVCAAVPKTLVWDGDAYAADSFTSLIPRIAERLPGLQLCAFAYEGWANEGTWAPPLSALPAPSPLTLVLVPKEGAPDHDGKYVRLGRLAIEATGSKSIFTLGGSSVALEEVTLALADEPPCRVVLAPVRRWARPPEPPPDGAQPPPRPLELEDSAECFTALLPRIAVLS